MVFTLFTHMKASICHGKRNVSILIHNSFLLCEFLGGRILMVVDAVELMTGRKKIPLANITRKW